MGGVLLLHAWWGVSPGVTAYGQRLVERGYLVAIPDLYGDGSLVGTVGEAQALHQRLDADGARERARAAADTLVAECGGPIAVVAFGMGCPFALEVGLSRDDVAAIVLHYGLGPLPPDARPGGSVLGHFGDHDEWLALSDVQAAGEQLVRAGVPTTFHAYAGARGWFAEADRPEYDRESAELAFTRTMALLAARLGGERATAPADVG